MGSESKFIVPLGLLGSDTNFAAVRHTGPQGKPRAWRIWVLTPKTLLAFELLLQVMQNRIAGQHFGHAAVRLAVFADGRKKFTIL